MNMVRNKDDLQRVIEEEEVLIVLIKSHHCSVCDAVAHQLSEFIKSNNDISSVFVQLEDVPNISGEFMVFSAPTVLLFIQGKEEWRGSRFVQWDELKNVIDKWKKYS
ncbi:thioredoxin family protein [Bacillus shivajii]|uniref:thioredoxin family protein n=1 Tax=Bacillus shivajii TaxID=1983719 RepID=UPI001CFB1F85|nr:thioredoxin family protein [Bacillus shivajii]UCZ54016.1 thioredoxin family protein [Bacillus shivajii]